MEMKSVQKIKRRSMRDEAYIILQDWSINGDWKTEQKLKDADLSEILGISRTPVREAMLKLEDEGLIISKANRWTMVAPINLQEAKEVYSIVKVLESLAIEQGINNVTEETIKLLNKINEQFKKELDHGNKNEAYELDFSFHDVIIKLSNNAELQRILTNLKLKIKRIEIHYFDKREQTLSSYEEHKEIIESLSNAELENIKKMIQNNWNQSLSRIEAIVK